MKTLLLLSFFLFSPFSTAASVDVTLKSLKGETVKLSDYRGKWVVLNFWASWCSPCVQELPELSAYQDANSDHVQVLGVNFEETTVEESLAFLKSIKPTNFPHLKYAEFDDSTGEGFKAEFFIDYKDQALSLKGLPMTFYINPKGEIRGTHLGPLTAISIQAELMGFNMMQMMDPR